MRDALLAWLGVAVWLSGWSAHAGMSIAAANRGALVCTAVSPVGGRDAPPARGRGVQHCMLCAHALSPGAIDGDEPLLRVRAGRAERAGSAGIPQWRVARMSFARLARAPPAA